MNEIISFSSEMPDDRLFSYVLSGQLYHFGITLGLLVYSTWAHYIESLNQYDFNYTSSVDYTLDRVLEYVTPEGYILGSSEDERAFVNKLSQDSRFLLVAFNEEHEAILQKKSIFKVSPEKNSEFSDNVLIFENPDNREYLVDLAIANHAMMTWNKNTFGDYDHLKAPFKVYGWGSAFSIFGQEIPNEGLIVNEISKRGGVIYAADYSRNLHIHGAIEPNEPVLAPDPVFENITDSDHLISFLMSDGDNLNVMKRLFQTTSTPKEIPIGWTVNPDAPKIFLKKIFDTADPRDSFVASPSGYGYCYPNKMPLESREYYSKETERVMQDLGLTILNQVNFSLSGLVNFVQDYIIKTIFWDPMPEFVPVNVDGMIIYDYFNYDMGHGKTKTNSINGKPVISGTKKLYFPGNYNQLLKRDYPVGGMTFIPVNLWAFPMVNITNLVHDIQAKFPHVKVVNTHQYFKEFEKRQIL
jgi:hypothetical protein